MEVIRGRDNHDFPMPHGPVTSRLRCSAIQLQVAICWNRALTSPSAASFSGPVVILKIEVRRILAFDFESRCRGPSSSIAEEGPRSGGCGSPRTAGRPLPSVWSVFMPMPKRMRAMRSSRGVNDANTRVVVSRRFDWIAASIGRIVFLSSMKSPRWESSSSSIGVSSSRGGCWAWPVATGTLLEGLVGGRTSATNRDKPQHFWQDERISSEHEPMRAMLTIR
jgi:hypothetical protein